MLLIERIALCCACGWVWGTADIKKGKGPNPSPSTLRDYFSLEQSRGVMLFSLAYCAAEASIIGRTIVWSEGIQSVITFHLRPFHCRNFTASLPSWSMQETL